MRTSGLLGFERLLPLLRRQPVRKAACSADSRRREWRAPPRADGRSLPRAPTGDRERLGEQRGKKIACVEVARLAEAIWHVLTPNGPSPRQVPRLSGRLTALLANWTPRANLPPT